MLLLTYLWNASPSVCEDTRQDLPSQLLLRCTGFAVRWERSSTEDLSTSAPRRNPLNSTQLSYLQHAGPGAWGGRDESDTVPAYREPPVCGRGQHTINYMDPGCLGTRAGIQVERQARLKRGKGAISLSESGFRRKPKTAALRDHSAASPLPVASLLGRAPWPLLSLPHAGLQTHQPPPSVPAPPSSLSSALEWDAASQLLTLPHCVNAFLFKLHCFPRAELPSGRE